MGQEKLQHSAAEDSTGQRRAVKKEGKRDLSVGVNRRRIDSDCRWVGRISTH